MTRLALRRTCSAAVAVVALTSLAACGGDDGGDDPSSGESTASSDSGDETAAADPSADAGSPTAEDSAEASLPGEEIEPEEFVDLYVGAIEDATTATLTLAFGGTAAFEGEGAADFSTTPPSMRLTMSDPSTGQEYRMVILDGTMYLGLRPDQYVSYDLNDPNSPLGADLTDQLDPGAMVEVFEKGIIGSSYVGEEDVQGEPMDHYRVVLDSSALLADIEMPSGLPSAAAGEQLTFDIWFDGEGNFRRQEAGLGANGGSVELRYDNWGEPVNIKAPPASQVTPAPGS